ncbi:magnesium transporter [Microcoleus sp. FACHB-672]|uniref:magnesium transporter n=1 Tax=Microcoleus sp. FACHB-672 TaxID=2692825 RepID=UPI001F552423|nr:magnesium transporter [Microcoleus sp. FACHB-672]
MGIITIDDVVDSLEEEATEDIQKLADVSGGDEAALSAPKEVLAGLGTAFTLGTTLILLSLIWTSPQSRWVGFVAGLVMAINVFVAVTLGTILPMGLKRLKLDPALISGPLLTTLLDAVGFMIFLSLIWVSLNILHLQP